MAREKKDHDLNNLFNFSEYDNHVYVYVRVSSDKQDVYSQLFEVKNFCLKERLYPKPENIIIDEAISGKVSWRNRKINTIIEHGKKGDIIIVPEFSRIGRDIYDTNEFIITIAKKEITTKAIKENYTFDGGPMGLVFAGMFGLMADTERERIRQRVKQGMAAMKAKGIPLKRGIRKNKLDGQETFITEALKSKKSIRALAEELNVKHPQLIKFIKDKNLKATN